jgi:hypothetical protein
VEYAELVEGSTQYIVSHSRIKGFPLVSKVWQFATM